MSSLHQSLDLVRFIGVHQNMTPEQRSLSKGLLGMYCCLDLFAYLSGWCNRVQTNCDFLVASTNAALLGCPMLRPNFVVGLALGLQNGRQVTHERMARTQSQHTNMPTAGSAECGTREKGVGMQIDIGSTWFYTCFAGLGWIDDHCHRHLEQHLGLRLWGNVS